jgi:tRNA nucleotidyltransferase/poly(A) polymerase
MIMKQRIKEALREGVITEERIGFNMFIPSDILELSKVFKKHNYMLLIVGGAVRDSILKKPIKDYDLTTDATPDKVEEMMKDVGLKTLPTGKAFGVINVFTDSGEYEIATMREDQYKSDGLEGFKQYLKGLNNGSYEKFINKLTK